MSTEDLSHVVIDIYALGQDHEDDENAEDPVDQGLEVVDHVREDDARDHEGEVVHRGLGRAVDTEVSEEEEEDPEVDLGHEGTNGEVGGNDDHDRGQSEIVSNIRILHELNL